MYFPNKYETADDELIDFEITFTFFILVQSILGKMPICSFGNFLPVNPIANQKKPSHQKQKNLHLIDNHWHNSIVETIKEDTDNFYNVLCFQDHPKEWKREIPQLQHMCLLMHFCCRSEKAYVCSHWREADQL